MVKVKLGIIGVGVMGNRNAKRLPQVDSVELTAVCDIDSKKADYAGKEYNVEAFHDAESLLDSGKVDAVYIATPHYQHTTIGIRALQKGIHVLSEKPISVHKADCERLIAAHTDEKVIFSAMFQQRTKPIYKKLKSMIDSGEFGKIQRICWQVTSWFRTQKYYDMGGWRATWDGEGGGVLLNQCPHQLDLWQWMFGMPKKVFASCQIARFHNIEVEDDVSAFFEYEDGTVGTFISSTGEAPGINRLDIATERGHIVIDKNENTIQWRRNEAPAREWSDTCKLPFWAPPTWDISIAAPKDPAGHMVIVENFASAILNGTPLISPAEEGIKSIELANAMLYSSMKGTPIELPLDSSKYEALLKKLIAESNFTKETIEEPESIDFEASF